mmetsp:Transcript_30733/g.51097  ORF Transcript_30733/g.51097 Transcript_30733/m.51097 type:complete len:230 (+) Transcript_30733:189-878(+)
MPVFGPFRRPIFAFAKGLEMDVVPFLKRSSSRNIDNLVGNRVPLHLGSSVWLTLVHYTSFWCDTFSNQSLHFVKLSRMDTDWILHDSPVIRFLPTFCLEISIARWDRLRARISKVVFRSNSKHGPIVEPFQFIILIKSAKVLVKLIGVVASVLHLLQSFVQVLLVFHLLRLLFNESLPVLLLRRSPVDGIHVNLHILVVRIVSVLIIVNDNILCGSNVRMVLDGTFGRL